MTPPENTPSTVSPTATARWLDRLRDVRIGVLGDLMLDRFLRGRVRRISPEAPVPIVEMDGSRDPLERPGGAANVAANLVALGARTTLFGVTGHDDDGARLLRLCERAGIETRAVTSMPGRPTTVKTRVVAQGQQIVRLDLEVTTPLPGDRTAALYGRLLDAAPELDAVIVSDYAKGVVVPGRFEGLLAELRERGTFVAIDPRVRHMGSYAGASVVTPNKIEVLLGVGRAAGDAADTETAARDWLNRLGCAAVLVTLGEDGMQLVLPGKPAVTMPTRAVEVFDVTGAGDTVIAALTLARVAGAGWRDAVTMANAAAGIVVGKRGTAVVRPADLRRELARR